MAGLQRSAVSFRRQGSSGFVWDDRFLSGELNKLNHNNNKDDDDDKKDGHDRTAEVKDLDGAKPAVGSIATVQRSRSTSNAAYRTGKVSPAIEPPSPKLSACGFCTAFGKTGDKAQRRRKPPPPPPKRRSR